MQKIYISILIMVFPSFLHAKDKIHLKDGTIKKGWITEIQEGKVAISNNWRGKKVEIYTPQDVDFIEFDLNNIDIAKIIALNTEDYTYLDGQRDAILYHKRFMGNFALGFFIPIFGFVGVAIGKVKLPPVYIEDWEVKMASVEYIEGYKKKGKRKNLLAAGIGLGLIIILTGASR